MRTELLFFAGTMIAIAAIAPRIAPAANEAAAAPAAQTQALQVAAADADPSLDNNVTALERAGDGHYYVTADVNAAPIRFLVDTGASVVALSEDDARRANIAFDPTAFAVIGEGAGGPVRGQAVTIDALLLDGRHEAQVPAVVLAGAHQSLLGQSLLSRYARIEIAGGRMLLR